MLITAALILAAALAVPPPADPLDAHPEPRAEAAPPAPALAPAPAPVRDGGFGTRQPGGGGFAWSPR